MNNTTPTQLRQPSSLNVLSKALWDWTTDIVSEVDSAGNCLYVNNVPAGRQLDDVIGTNYYDYIIPEHHNRAKAAIEQVFSTGQMTTCEVMVKVFGHTQWWSTRLLPIVVDDKMQSVLGISRNVTARKQKAAKLAESERMYRYLYDNSPDMMATLEPDTGIILNCNHKLIELTGYSREELIGMPFFKLYHESSIEEATKIFNGHANNSLDNYYGERIIICKDNSVLTTKVKGAVYFDSDGNIDSILSVWHDFTEQKRLQTELIKTRDDLAHKVEQRAKALADAEHLHHTLINAAPHVIWFSEPEGDVSYMNKAWEKLTGQRVEDALGNGWLKTFHPDDKHIVLTKYQGFDVEKLDDGVLYEEWRIMNAKGNYRIHSSVCSPVYNTEGEVTKWVGINTDITDLREAQKSIYKAELDKLQREHLLELAHVSRISSMGEMATSMAHELNQPLAAITNYINGTLRRLGQRDVEGNEPLVQAMKKAANEAKRASDIIQRIRDFVRKSDSRKESHDVNELLTESVEFLRSEIKQCDIQLDFELAEHLPNVWVDNVQLEQVFVNVVKNAIDVLIYCKRQRRNIALLTQLVDEGIAIYIHDTGPGIADDFKEKIFEPFCTTKPNGMGIGLSICSSIMESHDGSLSLHKTDKMGTTFKIMLPVKRKD